MCVRDRQPVFSDPAFATKAMESLREIHASGDGGILAATVMPNHVHLLFALGPRLRLGQVLAKFKTFARDRGQASWQWQEDSFERRLRAHESIEDYGFYVFMNPYRAGLLPLSQRWPLWFCPEPARFVFLSHLDLEHTVPDEWISKSVQLSAHLALRT